VTVLAFAGLQVLEDFISHPQPFEVHDANVFLAVFPDLALLKFERHAVGGTVSPILMPERRSRYFFLPAACLLATAAFFLAALILAFDCFWPDFFWLALGDLSPMMFCFLLPRLTRPRNESFPEGAPIMLAEARNVNDVK
jgi:hypothetical protein